MTPKLNRKARMKAALADCVAAFARYLDADFVESDRRSLETGSLLSKC